MPSGETKSERELELEGMVRELASRLAIAVAYLVAIDDSLDPLKRPHEWVAAALVMLAHKGVYCGATHLRPYQFHPGPVIDAADKNQPLDIKDTPLYVEAMDSVRKLIRDLNGQQPDKP